MSNSSLVCAKCKKKIKKGSTSYKIHIVIRSQWDEYLEEPNSIDELDKEIEEIIKDLAHLPPSLIESDIHQNFTFVLCRKCKEIFAANPLNLPLDFQDIPDSVPPNF